MKLKDVFAAAGERTDWVKFHWEWELTDTGNVIPKLPVNITLDSEVEICYQWFWHCNFDVDTKEIADSIESHNYQAFTKWFEKLSREQFTYLPTDAGIFVDDQYIGDVCVAFDNNMFALITKQDHECG